MIHVGAGNIISQTGEFIDLQTAGEEGLIAIMESTELMKKKEFEALFPDCEIWVEKLLWVFPKSYVAYRR